MNNEGYSEEEYSIDYREKLIGTWEYYSSNYSGGFAVTVLGQTFSTIVFYEDGTFTLGDIDGYWSLVHDNTAIELRDNLGQVKVYDFQVYDDTLTLGTDVASNIYVNLIKQE